MFDRAGDRVRGAVLCDALRTLVMRFMAIRASGSALSDVASSLNDISRRGVYWLMTALL